MQPPSPTFTLPTVLWQLSIGILSPKVCLPPPPLGHTENGGSELITAAAGFSDCRRRVPFQQLPGEGGVATASKVTSARNRAGHKRASSHSHKFMRPPPATAIPSLELKADRMGAGWAQAVTLSAGPRREDTRRFGQVATKTLTSEQFCDCSRRFSACFRISRVLPVAIAHPNQRDPLLSHSGLISEGREGKRSFSKCLS